MSEKNDLTTAIAEDFSGELEPIESAPMVEGGANCFISFGCERQRDS